MKTIFISVVRDKKMYHSLVKDNPYNQGGNFVYYDNTKENISIPKRYNDFLNNYDYKDPAWFIFCHEDWQTQSKWLYKLKHLNQNSLWGIFGTKLKLYPNNYGIKYYLGQIKASNKDGTNKHLIGAKVKTGTIVDTFDCMCLIIHSTLVEKYHIRFDNTLAWHQYMEELCIRMQEVFNIPSCILQINSQHWSWGNANEEFDKSFVYVKNKYKESKRVYTNTTNDFTIGRLNITVERYLNIGKRILSISFLGLPFFKIKYLTNNYKKNERNIK